MTSGPPPARHGVTNAVVRAFLHSNLSVVLILLASLAGVAALLVTPREEDPQIVVPMADVLVDFPGHSAREVEQLVTAPLEQMLYHIDGVEHVYSTSRADRALITVRFYVGEDRERSLVKLFKKIDENQDRIPPGVSGWVVKPVEIDDVPIVTLTLTGDPGASPLLRRVAEEVVQRLAPVRNVSRAYVVGGEPRVVSVWLDPARLAAHGLAPLDVRRALASANLTRRAGTIDREDEALVIEVGDALSGVAALREVVVGVFDGRPVRVGDVARVEDHPREASSLVRHGWGPAVGSVRGAHAPGATLEDPGSGPDRAVHGTVHPAVTIALAKKKGTNAVRVAEEILAEYQRLRPLVVPADVRTVVTRNSGLSADEKVNELVESLGIAIVIVVAVLTLGLGWRESLIVCVAVPVVFGLTLFVNLLAGFSINRVTLFALILSLGLLVDDPIVDVENVARHFRARGRATREIVLQAIAEIRPPLIVATLAVIVSFLPMFFITGMMGPYMRPMALNVPMAMLMSMLVAFTITPWLAFHVLRRRAAAAAAPGPAEREADDIACDPRGALSRLFRPLMAPLLRSRRVAAIFLAVVGVLTAATMLLGAVRAVPLKMLPFGNKDQLQLVLDFDEGTTLERADAAVRHFESHLATLPEVTCFTSYVGTASPMDFNGLVRHHSLRAGRNVADIVVNLAPRKSRSRQSHTIALAMRPALTDLARRHSATLEIVEVPPGPPTLAPVVAEVYGRPDHGYDDLVAAARTVRRRLAREPGVVDVDDSIEAPQRTIAFVVDKEKAALNGTSTEEIAATLSMAIGGDVAGVMHVERERHPLLVRLQLPRAERSTPITLAALRVRGREDALVPLAELGTWEERRVDPAIHHKDLRQVAYVFADAAGRPPADAVVDVLADRVDAAPPGALLDDGGGWVAEDAPRPLRGRTFLRSGSGVGWSVPAGVEVEFAGEGEWQMTLDVFRDLGLAFAVALVGIYVLLVAQLRSFAIPVIVMLAIPLTVLGILPGFWLLNRVAGGTAGGFDDPTFFTATAMIGMIALAGIVTRQSVILVDFIHLALARGRSLVEAIIASCVVRMRPILLTAGTAMLSAIPITLDPVFSGLAWALIFGLAASTAFTLFVVPVTYWLVYERRPGHGLSPLDEVA
jgi:multidrug efflux pump subunit AcrB